MQNLFVQIALDPFYFEKIEDGDKTEDLALLAVSTNPESLRIIPKEFQTEAVCKIALMKNSLVLKYILQPNQLHYNSAILFSGRKDLEVLLDVIPKLDINDKVYKTLIRRSSPTKINDWLLKFHRSFWLKSKIIDSIGQDKTFSHAIRLPLCNFLLDQKIYMNPSERKRVLTMSIPSNSKSSGITEKDIVWFLKKRIHLLEGSTTTNVTDLLEKWGGCLNLTFEDFHEIVHMRVALELCKNPSYKIIMLCAMRNKDPWEIINLLLKKNLLTSEILVDIVTLTSKELINTKGWHQSMNKKRSDELFTELGQILEAESLDLLKKIVFSFQQLNSIQQGSVILYEYLKQNNVNLHKKVLIKRVQSKRNVIQEDWNVHQELNHLKMGYGDVNVESKDNLTYKFYKGGIKIESVHVLD